MKEQWKKELEPFAILAAGVNEDLENRAEEDLRILLDACQQPTQTNCWCWTHQAAKWIRPLVEEELSRREYANKRHNVKSMAYLPAILPIRHPFWTARRSQGVAWVGKI